MSHIGFSDHSLIYVSRKLTCPRSFPRIIESRQYKNFMPDYFLDDIALVPWDIIESIDNPIRAWEVWKHSFLAVANLHAPVKKKRVKNSKAPWLTPEIKQLMWERDRTKRIATVTNDQLKWAEYRRLRIELTILLRLPNRIIIILILRITLVKQNQLRMVFYTTIAKENLCSGDKIDYW